MGIDRDKSSISNNIPLGTNAKSSKKESNSPESKDTKGSKFISKDVKNYFAYNLKTDFKRASNSKNSVTYDLNSFDEKKP